MYIKRTPTMQFLVLDVELEYPSEAKRVFDAYPERIGKKYTWQLIFAVGFAVIGAFQVFVCVLTSTCLPVCFYLVCASMLTRTCNGQCFYVLACMFV